MIYILHFNTPLKHAEHYAGFAENGATLDRRLWLHAHGKSHVKMLDAAYAANITYTVAILLEGDRHLERRIKQRGVKRCCPICNPQYNLRQFLKHTPPNGKESSHDEHTHLTDPGTH